MSQQSISAAEIQRMGGLDKFIARGGQFPSPAPSQEPKGKQEGKAPSEHEEQAALFNWWRSTAIAHPALMWAIPNGGRRDKITGARLKAEGVMAGIPDIFLSWPAHGFHGLFIEMKTLKGCLKDSQREVCEALRKAGYRVEVCRGWEKAKRVIESYLGDAPMRDSGKSGPPTRCGVCPKCEADSMRQRGAKHSHTIHRYYYTCQACEFTGVWREVDGGVKFWEQREIRRTEKTKQEKTA